MKNLSAYCLRNGSYGVLDSLVQNGTKDLFGYPGGAILPFYDELFFWEKLGIIRHTLVRHEQSAAHAADAYSRSSNSIGVCIATSGPGATNFVTGIANAKMDSIPIIIITGQVSRPFVGTDAFQEIDMFSTTLPITKQSYTIFRSLLLTTTIFKAFFLSQNGKPGPILIDIPKDIALERIKMYSYQKASSLFLKKSTKILYLSNFKILNRLALLLNNSLKPLFYAGGGILRSNAFKIIQFLSKIYQVPVSNTLMAKSTLNEEDHLSLGMLGMHGTAYANFSMSKCDLLVALASRFDDRVTGKLEEFASKAYVIHIDIDPAEISKNRLSQASVIGDIKKLFAQFARFLRRLSFANLINRDWMKKISSWKKNYPLLTTRTIEKKLSAQQVIDYLTPLTKGFFFTTDVGQHQMWAAQRINTHPKKWVSSSGLGAMGFGLPAAIGVKQANKKKVVICISGDASFQMSIQELGVIKQYELNIKIIIINNGWQGMVRQWQESFYEGRFSNSCMNTKATFFSNIANAYGIDAFSIITKQQLSFFFSKIIKSKYKKPLLASMTVLEKENCYPMIIPGRSSSQMIGLKKWVE